MDPNRSLSEAYEHPLGAQAYEDFHGSLKNTLRAAAASSDRVLLVDIHGQTRHPADICIGTHDGQTLRMLRAGGKDEVMWPAVDMGRQLVDAGFSVPGLVEEMETDWIGKRREASARRVDARPAEGGAMRALLVSLLLGVTSAVDGQRRRARMFGPGVRRQ